MKASLRALLSEAIDYAGMFPPANLSLDEAIHNYARYRTQPEAWMPGRFICPVEELSRLRVHQNLFAEGQPPRLSVLLSGADDLQSFHTDIRDGIEKLRRFQSECGAWVSVEALETRLPAGLEPTNVRFFLNEIQRSFNDAGIAMPGQVYELPPGVPDLALLRQFSGSITNRAGECARLRRILKLRCGGVEPGAFPAAERVASIIRLARDAGVPLKFTSGLHHPIRRVDPGQRCYTHGFLNVFVAGVLAFALALDFHDILAIVQEEDPGQFRFVDDGLEWNEARANLADIEHARKHLVTSFGSCSFDEPREDLKALGLM